MGRNFICPQWKREARTVALWCVLLVACGLVDAPVLAQTSESRLINTPAEQFLMTPGGVDMRTGRYAYNETDLSIGGEGGALALTRTLAQAVSGHRNPFAGFSHNWDIMISELRININNPAAAGTDYRIMVHFGGRSQTYEAYGTSGWGFAQKSGGGYAPLTYAGDRASASVVYTYQAADGTVAVFRPLGGGDCSSTFRCAFISQLTEADGTVYTFDYTPSGSPFGTGGTQRLRQVTSSRGYALLLEGIENRVTKACVINLAQMVVPASGLCPANVTATSTYSYEMISGWPAVDYRLTSATSSAGGVSGFIYGSGTIGFVRPGETQPWLTNTIGSEQDENYVAQEIVLSQSFADGQTYVYSYGRAPITDNNPNPTIAGGFYTHVSGGLSYTVSLPYAWPLASGSGNPGSPCVPAWPPCPLEQPDGFLHYVYQQTPGPVTITDALNRTTTLDYCDPIPMAQLPPNEANRCVVVPLVSFTDPEGIRTDLQYDGNRNITQVRRHARSGSGLPDIVTSAVYDVQHPRSSSKPLSMTDALGNVTEFTYAPEHGGLLTQTGPAVNGVRPQTRHEYAQRYAWILGAGYVPAATPVWVRTATSICRTSAATGNLASPCAVAGDEVRTMFEYGPNAGPNNLLLRGQVVTADGQSLRACYGYDVQGNRISETQPNANLASCP